VFTWFDEGLKTLSAGLLALASESSSVAVFGADATPPPVQPIITHWRPANHAIVDCARVGEEAACALWAGWGLTLLTATAGAKPSGKPIATPAACAVEGFTINNPRINEIVRAADNTFFDFVNKLIPLFS